MAEASHTGNWQEAVKVMEDVLTITIKIMLINYYIFILIILTIIATIAIITQSS